MEALLASTMLSMGASAVLLPFNVGAQTEQEDARRTVALYFARELMEEIIVKPFDDPQDAEGLGADAGESSRALYDNIDDYDGYEDGYGKAIDQIVGVSKQTIDSLSTEGLSREVTVAYLYVSGQDSGGPANFVSVTVTMKYYDDTLLTIRRLVHNPSVQ
ncbi:MAG: hypothetical protein HN350_07245 [Phycisphaerales bacterium]|nr:hypothetical protein [Phycisphaerales bacterium]